MNHCSQPCTPCDEDEIACIKNRITALDLRDQGIDARLAVLEAAYVKPKLIQQGVFGFVADAGEIGVTQSAVALGLQLMTPTAVFFGGDNQYASNTAAAWASFQELIDGGKAYPCFGNHEYDLSSGAGLRAKFPTLFADNDYYDVEFDDGDVHFFCLTDGRKTNYDTVVDAGIGSDQYKWFLEKLQASKRKWKIVMFHRPTFHVTQHDVGQTIPAAWMDWGFEKLGIHLVLNGHEHTVFHARRDGLDYLNVSTGSKDGRDFIEDVSTDPSVIVNGDDNGHSTYVVWKEEEDLEAHSTKGLYSKIIATHDALYFEVYDSSGNTLIHTNRLR